MKPRIFKVDPLHIDLDLLKQAAEVVNNRGLVAFPTETVYGLGADALDGKAVARIFEAKKRPLDDPIIVHIAKKEDLYRLVEEVPKEVEKIIDRFWPGPLTVVLKKTKIVPDIVTTGLDSVAVRMPSNEIARKFIEIAGTPIAAPSANLFGKPSPTKAKHVINDLGERIDIVIDGGTTEIGIESTVVEFVDGKTLILRPGGISVEELKAYSDNIEITSDPLHGQRTPGKYPQHYSPSARVIVVEEGDAQVEDVLAVLSDLGSHGHNIGVLARQEHAENYKQYNVKVLGKGEDGRTCASRLFNLLREFDAEGAEVIVAEGVVEKGLGRAVMNRLRKAAGPDLFSS